ncbi:MAG: hypothetical protein G01um101470_295 [Parcubacteria group bacterium Gr01-1014_70]|nr:MAG: hypothetical protein G01um101470_295 [Parcubacteria group bacterium Gr01-1014_70]
MSLVPEIIEVEASDAQFLELLEQHTADPNDMPLAHDDERRTIREYNDTEGRVTLQRCLIQQTWT